LRLHRRVERLDASAALVLAVDLCLPEPRPRPGL
jgi:hypothetical protein